MVIRAHKCRSGWLSLDLGIAISLLIFAVLPLAFSFAHEQKLCRAYYFKAIATQIVDGEFEALVAGEWKNYREGTQPYPVRCGSATNLPPGQFLLTLRGTEIRLEWVPEKDAKGGRVRREAKL